MQQHNVDYLKYTLIPSLHNEQLPLCPNFEKMASNGAMKPSKLNGHFRKLHPNKADKDVGYFKDSLDKHIKKKTSVDMFSAEKVRKICTQNFLHY